MKIIQVCALFIALFLSQMSNAQLGELLEEKQFRNGHISFAKVKKEKVGIAISKKDAIIMELTGNRNDISFVKNLVDIPFKGKLKIRQEKFQVYRNGIPLRGSEYVLNIVNDTISFVHGFFAALNNEEFQPQYEAQVCAGLAVKQFNSLHQFKDSDEASADKVKSSVAVYYFDYAVQNYRPAYQVQVTSKNMAYSENIFISAATGLFLGAENLICSINFPGTSETRYSGNRNIVTDAQNAAGPFSLQERRGNNVLIRTRNMNNRTDFSMVTNFVDDDNNWTAAEHGANQAAIDAHWGAETVFDYWLTVHNRNSLDGNGMAIESYVHFGASAFNAHWFQNSLLYGDGIWGVNPLTSLDICAHEFGHGIDQFTGDLKYERESGALDEGFADIWAACVEAWADPTKNPWLMGDEVLGGPLRNMANPNQFGQPDTYQQTNWTPQAGCTPSAGNDFCGVHTNSGVLNFWFFLLSQGGTGTNDLNNAYNVNGLGIKLLQGVLKGQKKDELVMPQSSTSQCLNKKHLKMDKELFMNTMTI